MTLDVTSDADYGRWVVGLATAAALAIGVTATVLMVRQYTTLPVPLTSAHVKIETSRGHGSATHIGDGLYLTAAHVIGDGASIKISGHGATLLWANASYDIALVSGPEIAASVPLACYTPQLGEAGEAHGNPMELSDITTTARVAGSARTIGEWKLAIPVDGALGPGMSGGAFVIGGALVGVNVGSALAPTGRGASFFGLAVVVPGSVVCDLMGRK